MKYFVIISLIFCVACERPMPCNSKHTPLIRFVGFDTSELKLLLAEKYLPGGDFDSLFSSFSLSSNYFKVAVHTDTMDVDLFDFFKYSPDFDWHIKLQNGQELFISNLTFNSDKCDRHDYDDIMNPCICTLRDMNISVINCSYKIENSYNTTIYLHK